MHCTDSFDVSCFKTVASAKVRQFYNLIFVIFVKAVQDPTDQRLISSIIRDPNGTDELLVRYRQVIGN